MVRRWPSSEAREGCCVGECAWDRKVERGFRWIREGKYVNLLWGYLKTCYTKVFENYKFHAYPTIHIAHVYRDIF